MSLPNPQFNSIIDLIREIAHKAYRYGKRYQGEGETHFSNVSWLTDSELKQRLREALNK